MLPPQSLKRSDAKWILIWKLMKVSTKEDTFRNGLQNALSRSRMTRYSYLSILTARLKH